MIDEAKKKGGCHLPTTIPEWPKWQSEEFARGMAKGCPQCKKAWTNILAVKANRNSPWHSAVIILTRELPGWAAQIKFMDEFITSEGDKAIPLPELHDYLPRKYQGTFALLFET